MADRGRPVRFLVVGALNTAIDFILLFLLTSMGLAVWPANMISTASALIFSYLANRTFTFRAAGGGRWQVFRFIVVTMFGLWVLQPLVIGGIALLFQERLAPPYVLGIGKLVATVVTLIWNYILYRSFVFRNAEEGRGA